MKKATFLLLLLSAPVLAVEEWTASWSLGVDASDRAVVSAAAKLPEGTILKFRKDFIAEYIYDKVCKHGSLEVVLDYFYCEVTKKEFKKFDE
jgi:hypothetical protein